MHSVLTVYQTDTCSLYSGLSNHVQLIKTQHNGTVVSAYTVCLMPFRMY